MRNFTITYILFIVVLFLIGEGSVSGQISKPSFSFTQACASDNFNSYTVRVSFTHSLQTSNQFIVELSDASGSFSSSTELSPSVSIAGSTADLTFSFPTTVAGEAYKLRVKTTAPAATSSSSDAFPAYYLAYNTAFNINNLIETGIYCAGESYLLAIDDGPESDDSPLDYPSLTYNWYREVTQTTSVFVESGPSLTVTSPGTYFAEIEYGACSSSIYSSNRVIVSEAAAGAANSDIVSSLGNPFCSSSGPTILSSVSGDSYQWYKNGVEIDGATSQTYETDESGTFSVSIGSGVCVITSSIDLASNDFNSSIDVLDVNVLDEGETLTATITTEANSPEFEWYFNDTLITEATTNSFTVSQIGSYRVLVRQTLGCLSSDEFLFTIQEPVDLFPDIAIIPNIVSPNGDGSNDTWMIPQEFVTGTNTEVMIFSAQGEVVFQTNDYQNDWPQDTLSFKDVNPVYYYILTRQDKVLKRGTITVIR